MEGIFAWIRNIACLYLMLSLIMNLLPDVEEKKYIQFYGSVLVTICLLRPILQLADFGERLEQNVISNVLEEAYEEIERETSQQGVVGASYVRESCEKQMTQQMEEWMGVYGYDLVSCEIEFSEGEVMELEILNIKVKSREESQQSKSGQEDFLKNELRNVYKIPEGNINISIQG